MRQYITICISRITNNKNLIQQIWWIEYGDRKSIYFDGFFGKFIQRSTLWFKDFYIRTE